MECKDCSNVQHELDMFKRHEYENLRRRVADLELIVENLRRYKADADYD